MKFLVAVDGSDASEAALAHAIDVADAMAASLAVVHTVDPAVFEVSGNDSSATPVDADRRLVVQSVEEAEDRGLAILDDAAGFAEERGADVETTLVYGDPAAAVADLAAEEGFDAVFVGHRGRSERSDLMLGSVAKGLVERATVPVTVVR